MTVLLVILSVFGLVSCKQDKTTTIDPDFVIEIPTNLQINGKMLEWDAVDLASGYYIYVNDELQTRVTTTNYDFSSLTDEVLIFKVQADAPQGFEDSARSLSIAYIANIDYERTVLSSMLSNMNVPEGFVDALLYKGMTSESMSIVLSGISDILFIITNEPTMQDVLSELQLFVSLNINYEALFYALLSTLPEAFQEEIIFYTSIIDELGDCDVMTEIDNCTMIIDQYTSYIEAMNETISLIQNNPDEILFSLLSSVSYIESLAGLLDPELVIQIQEVINSENPASLNANELLIVKSEIVDGLLENIPSTDDIALLIQVGGSFFSAYGSPMPSRESAIELANQLVISIETFAGIIDSIDADVITEISNILENYPETYQPELIIYLIEHFHDYFENHPSILLQWNTFMSDDKKEELVTSLITLFTTSFHLSIDLSYEVVDVIIQSLFDQTDIIYQWFLDTDGNIVRLYYEISLIDVTGNSYPLSVLYARVKYEWLMLCNYLIPSINDTVSTLLKTSLSMIPIENISKDISDEDYQAIMTLLNDYIDEEIPNLLAFFNTNLSEAIDIDFYNVYLAELEQLHIYATNVYGPEYELNEEYYSDPAFIYFDIYMQEKLISLVISSSDQTFINDFIDSLFATLSTDVIYDNLVLDQEFYDEVKRILKDHFNLLIDSANEISGYDLYHLSEEEITKMNTLLLIIF